MSRSFSFARFSFSSTLLAYELRPPACSHRPSPADHTNRNPSLSGLARLASPPGLLQGKTMSDLRTSQEDLLTVRRFDARPLMLSRKFSFRGTCSNRGDLKKVPGTLPIFEMIEQ